MVRKTYNPEQIINKLREAAIHINQGNTIGVVSFWGASQVCSLQQDFNMMICESEGNPLV